MASKKKDSPATISAGGAPHVIYKKGEKVVADHLGKSSKDKMDKIDLTKVAGAKTVKEGVKATKDWHKKHPHKKEK